MKALVLAPLVTCTLAAACIPAAAVTIYVPGVQPTIQAGLAAASADDTVLVACGPYYEHSLVMKSGVCLRSETGEADCVTIDGQGLGRVIFCDNVDNAASIVGFTIVGGKAFQGGGLFCRRSSPAIRNCTFRDNSAAYGGGAYCSWYSAPTLDDVVFTLNEADSLGAGMTCQYYSDAVLNHVVFSENDCVGSVFYSDLGGGGMCAYRSSPSLTDVTFTGNTAEKIGGGLFSFGDVVATSRPVLTRVSFVDNRAEWYGGGMAGLRSAGELTDVSFTGNWGGDGGGIGWEFGKPGLSLTRVTFSGNSAYDGGGFYTSWSNPPMTLVDCVFQGNWAGDGGGAYIQGTGAATLTRAIFASNLAERGGAIYCMDAAATLIENCTLVENSASSAGAGLHSRYSAAPTLLNTIIAFSTEGRAVTCDGGTATLTCCDVFGNAGGNWIGCIAAQGSINNNMSIDPLFCRGENPDNPYTLHSNSPCAPEFSPVCGLIGARDVGCGASAVEFTSWGAMKALFR